MCESPSRSSTTKASSPAVIICVLAAVLLGQAASVAAAPETGQWTVAVVNVSKHKTSFIITLSAAAAHIARELACCAKDASNYILFNSIKNVARASVKIQ